VLYAVPAAATTRYVRTVLSKTNLPVKWSPSGQQLGTAARSARKSKISAAESLIGSLENAVYTRLAQNGIILHVA
jgi:hypothetical protein